MSTPLETSGVRPEAAASPLEAATRHQPRARAALTAALAGTPSHAYLFRGPRGSGKGEALRAFAAELLAEGAPDPESARRRVMLDPSPHPDLVWLRPPGAWHLVDDVRESVIRAASLRPAEGERRVFVIAEAEALRDESQNALLKTLEEPAPFAHLLLSCSEPELLAGTILSRCQPVEFVPLAPEAVLERLTAEGADPGDPGVRAAARLCGGDMGLARLLGSAGGAEIRTRAERAARAAMAPAPTGEPPWRDLLEAADAAGSEAGEAEHARVAEQAESGRAGGRGAGKLTKEQTDQVKRAERRARTRAIDVGLGLCAAWYRDVAAVAGGAPELAFNADRERELSADAEGVGVAAAGRAVALVSDTRRRLRLNVAEELALEALWLRLEEALT